MSIAPVRDQLGRNVAYAKGRSIGREEGRNEGRREMLWLMAVGAGVAVWQFGYRLRCPYTEESIRPHFDDTRFSRWVRDHALRALADLGDERAISMVQT